MMKTLNSWCKITTLLLLTTLTFSACSLGNTDPAGEKMTKGPFETKTEIQSPLTADLIVMNNNAEIQEVKNDLKFYRVRNENGWYSFVIKQASLDNPQALFAFEENEIQDLANEGTETQIERTLGDLKFVFETKTLAELFPQVNENIRKIYPLDFSNFENSGYLTAHLQGDTTSKYVFLDLDKYIENGNSCVKTNYDVCNRFANLTRGLGRTKFSGNLENITDILYQELPKNTVIQDNLLFDWSEIMGGGEYVKYSLDLYVNTTSDAVFYNKQSPHIAANSTNTDLNNFSVYPLNSTQSLPDLEGGKIYTWQVFGSKSGDWATDMTFIKSGTITVPEGGVSIQNDSQVTRTWNSTTEQSTQTAYDYDSKYPSIYGNLSSWGWADTFKKYFYMDKEVFAGLRVQWHIYTWPMDINNGYQFSCNDKFKLFVPPGVQSVKVGFTSNMNTATCKEKVYVGYWSGSNNVNGPGDVIGYQRHIDTTTTSSIVFSITNSNATEGEWVYFKTNQCDTTCDPKFSDKRAVTTYYNIPNDGQSISRYIDWYNRTQWEDNGDPKYQVPTVPEKGTEMKKTANIQLEAVDANQYQNSLNNSYDAINNTYQ